MRRGRRRSRWRRSGSRRRLPIWRSATRSTRTRFTVGRSSFWSRRRGRSRAAPGAVLASGARDRAAAREDRRAHRGAGFFGAQVREMSASDRRALVDRGHGRLSIRRQCALLGLARSGVYRPARPADEGELAVLRRLDELYTAWPFLGSRRLVALLRAEGHVLNRKRVQRLMRSATGPPHCSPRSMS
jgi:hypothetical protein